MIKVQQSRWRVQHRILVHDGRCSTIIYSLLSIFGQTQSLASWLALNTSILLQVKGCAHTKEIKPRQGLTHFQDWSTKSSYVDIFHPTKGTDYIKTGAQACAYPSQSSSLISWSNVV